MKHPYLALPDHCFWRRSIADRAKEDVDPVIAGKFRIRKSDPVMTAGSCFAQNISRHLSGKGFTYLVTEPAHPIFHEAPTEGFNYGVYSARYGNIYTSRQMLQLLQRAYGHLQPLEDAWDAGDGRVIDPFRPQIQPNGFATAAEFASDRQQHFAAVRRAIEALEVFVLTLGLTEAWVNLADGVVFPLCPGVAGGHYDASRHAFINFNVSQVIADLEQIVGFIRQRNDRARFVLTVSPVPLVATATDRSVLAATTYSKSVLRVAAEDVANQHPDVAYFPAYEIVTGGYTRGAYFADDLRTVTAAGVDRVMELFLRHYADIESQPTAPAPGIAYPSTGDLARISQLICEEEMLDHR